MDENFPGIQVNLNQICNICEHFQKNIIFHRFSKLREKKNLNELKKAILKNKNNKYDCLIGVSGGVDSSYVALLAFQLNLNPLLVTIDNGWNSLNSYENISKLVDYTNFDIESVHLDWKKFKLMQKKLITTQVADLEILTDHYIFSNLFRLAKKKKIKYILIGNNFISEHTNLKELGWNKRDGDHIKKILNFEENFFKDELKIYSYYYFLFFGKSKIINEVPILNLINYDPKKAQIEMEEKFGFNSYKEKHYESTFTKFFQGYYLVKKFNIDKRKIHFSEKIRNNLMTIEEANLNLNLPPINQNEEKDLVDFFKKKIDMSHDEMKKMTEISSNFVHKDFSTSNKTKLLNLGIKIHNFFKNYFLKTSAYFFDFNYETKLNNYYSTISFINLPEEVGGPRTFQYNLIKFLNNNKWGIFYRKNNIKTDFIFIVGASWKSLFWIIKSKFKGTKIIQRLDGKKWIYKYRFDFREKVFSILQNILIYFTQFLADKIIYQSNYVEKLWVNRFIKNKTTVIYNGSANNFQKREYENLEPTLLSVEGNIDSAFKSKKIIISNNKYNHEIYGEISDNLKKEIEKNVNVKVNGIVSREKILEILKKKKKYIFVSLEMNAACPNSVIEALNHGIPVIGYNMGSMKEIVSKENGVLINVDDKLNFKEEDFRDAIKKISENYHFYNSNLSKLNNKFKLDHMLKRYKDEFENSI